ncbi:MAG: hypothetical protein RIS34_2410 [Pseudomonadota bacterium]|jgi:hypothetical protein
MIAFNRTASIAPGKNGSAIAFAQEIATYMKNAYDVSLEVLTPIGGNPNRITWSARYKDLAALDAVNTKILSDKQYWEVLSKATDCFLPGSVHDSIWRTL